MRELAAALAATALVLVAGCGDAEDDVTTTAPEKPVASTPAPQTEPTPEPLPKCAAVWPGKATLPDGYLGCREDGKRVVKSVRCETGQQLFTYSGHYFAVPGGPIFAADGALADDARFQKMERVCRA